MRLVVEKLAPFVVGLEADLLTSTPANKRKLELFGQFFSTCGISLFEMGEEVFTPVRASVWP